MGGRQQQQRAEGLGVEASTTGPEEVEAIMLAGSLAVVGGKTKAGEAGAATDGGVGR